MNEFMKILLSLSVSGALLLLLILGLKPLYKNRFSKRWQYYIWIVVALRFLLPFTPDNAIVGSLFEKIDTVSSLDKGKQKTNNIIGCQPYTKHRFQQNRSGVFVCVLDIVTRSAPARFHRSVHGVSAGFIPRRRATHSTAGAACQGQSRRCAAVLRTLDWLSRLCYLPRRDGGYILQSRPLSLDRERAGG